MKTIRLLVIIVFYFASQTVSAQETYNHLSTIDSPALILLSDGSKVCLNTKTTLGYPAAFSEKQKTLDLNDGEAYFELTSKTKAKEIKVNQVVVYPSAGSAFNISVTDSLVIIMPVKGSVDFILNGKTTFLKPFEEAVINKNVLTINTGKSKTGVGSWRKIH